MVGRQCLLLGHGGERTLRGLQRRGRGGCTPKGVMQRRVVRGGLWAGREEERRVGRAQRQRSSSDTAALIRYDGPLALAVASV